MNMKSILFAIIFITIFSSGKSNFWQDISFLQDEFLKLFFPKNPGLERVRRIDQTERMIINAKVLDFIGMVEQYDYPAEEHNVTTEDGYNLKIHRIPGSPLLDKNVKKEIIFLQHGMLASSECWIMYGPGKDLAFLLADRGYDVWFGNMRGSTYCRSHVNMTIYDRKFWQYSFHEVGTKDLPTMIDYILKYTNQKDLYYIGHSMGTTSLFALLSTKPEYNIKVKMAICLSPVVFWIELSPEVYAIAEAWPTIKEILEKHEIYDIFPQSLTTVTLARTLCKNNVTQIICATILFLLAGADPAQLNTTSLSLLFSHFPAGTSVQQFDHYYQSVRTKDFQNYDYGTNENYKRYKQATPPKYDLKKVTAPIVLLFAEKDTILRTENVIELNNRLPNVRLMEKVPYKHFSHIDFIWAINAKSLLYDRILGLMQMFD
ncbi:lipase 3 [Solenopsis invicta]|uniref:lipase 3 n=1 Tax=Solenopsis invicta TaxID=13686 RepID=UPI000E33DCF9|nr:lipase 3 [Solenopsis invicta]